jgi:YD repeat-containing protein
LAGLDIVDIKPHTSEIRYMSSGETTNNQWTAGFSYDNNGNMLTATDAKNLTISSTYDALNRMLTKSYSDSITPTVNYTYDDPNVLYSKGQLYFARD